MLNTFDNSSPSLFRRAGVLPPCRGGHPHRFTPRPLSTLFLQSLLQVSLIWSSCSRVEMMGSFGFLMKTRPAANNGGSSPTRSRSSSRKLKYKYKIIAPTTERTPTRKQAVHEVEDPGEKENENEDSYASVWLEGQDVNNLDEGRLSLQSSSKSDSDSADEGLSRAPQENHGVKAESSRVVGDIEQLQGSSLSSSEREVEYHWGNEKDLVDDITLPGPPALLAKDAAASPPAQVLSPATSLGFSSLQVQVDTGHEKDKIEAEQNNKLALGRVKTTTRQDEHQESSSSDASTTTAGTTTKSKIEDSAAVKWAIGLVVLAVVVLVAVGAILSQHLSEEQSGVMKVSAVAIGDEDGIGDDDMFYESEMDEEDRNNRHSDQEETSFKKSNDSSTLVDHDHDEHNDSGLHATSGEQGQHSPGVLSFAYTGGDVRSGGVASSGRLPAKNVQHIQGFLNGQEVQVNSQSKQHGNDLDRPSDLSALQAQRSQRLDAKRRRNDERKQRKLENYVDHAAMMDTKEGRGGDGEEKWEETDLESSLRSGEHLFVPRPTNNLQESYNRSSNELQHGGPATSAPIKIPVVSVAPSRSTAGAGSTTSITASTPSNGGGSLAATALLDYRNKRRTESPNNTSKPAGPGHEMVEGKNMEVQITTDEQQEEMHVQRAPTGFLPGEINQLVPGGGVAQERRTTGTATSPRNIDQQVDDQQRSQQVEKVALAKGWRIAQQPVNVVVQRAPSGMLPGEEQVAGAIISPTSTAADTSYQLQVGQQTGRQPSSAKAAGGSRYREINAINRVNRSGNPSEMINYSGVIASYTTGTETAPAAAAATTRSAGPTAISRAAVMARGPTNVSTATTANLGYEDPRATAATTGSRGTVTATTFDQRRLPSDISTGSRLTAASTGSGPKPRMFQNVMLTSSSTTTGRGQRSSSPSSSKTPPALHVPVERDPAEATPLAPGLTPRKGRGANKKANTAIVSHEHSTQSRDPGQETFGDAPKENASRRKISPALARATGAVTTVNALAHRTKQDHVANAAGAPVLSKNKNQSSVETSSGQHGAARSEEVQQLSPHGEPLLRVGGPSASVIAKVAAAAKTTPAQPKLQTRKFTRALQEGEQDAAELRLAADMIEKAKQREAEP
ncbi:unnamed protein product [Amoebophrya sp. A120]|nr:unnamed protein product [Amoebophrya sp. A120]|eukprot:GSA120T00017650001.1